VAVTNGPNETLALSRDGDVERRYSWMLHDVEACPYAARPIGNCEERRQSRFIVIPIDERRQAFF